MQSDLMQSLIGITDTIDTYMYTYCLVILLIAAGIYFSVRTKFVQLRYIKDMIQCVTEKKHVKGEHSVSAFQALMMSTASRVGTGNIAGVSTAIALGGPGAITLAPATSRVSRQQSRLAAPEPLSGCGSCALWEAQPLL